MSIVSSYIAAFNATGKKVIPRGKYDSINILKNKVIWWKKGCNNYYYFKASTLTSSGQYIEEIGESLATCLKSLWCVAYPLV